LMKSTTIHLDQLVYFLIMKAFEKCSQRGSTVFNFIRGPKWKVKQVRKRTNHLAKTDVKGKTIYSYMIITMTLLYYQILRGNTSTDGLIRCAQFDSDEDKHLTILDCWVRSFVASLLKQQDVFLFALQNIVNLNSTMSCLYLIAILKSSPTADY
ncbi:hypothetical protein T11_3048, partial [Trichinella zimbabwensis]